MDFPVENYTNMMSIWVAAKCTIKDRPYVCLRVVNLDGEYDARYPLQEHKVPFAHVPSKKVPFTSTLYVSLPEPRAFLAHVWNKVQEDWPFLPAISDKTLLYVDQGGRKFGGTTPDGSLSEPVIRVALDLGAVEKLPDPAYRCGVANLPFKRQPTLWVPARKVTHLETGTLKQDVYRSPFILWPRQIVAETDTQGGTRDVALNAILLQDTVGGVFLKGTPNLFPRRAVPQNVPGTFVPDWR